MKKLTLTVAAAAVTAAVLGSASAYAHTASQYQHTSDRAGMESFAQQLPGITASGQVVAEYGRVLGQDPDANVRLQLKRDYTIYNR